MTLTIVTSFNARLWDAYARYSLTSWLRHLKGDYHLVITMDGPIPSDMLTVLGSTGGMEYDSSTGVALEIISLDNIPEYRMFLERFPNVPPPPGAPQDQYYRWDYRRFWPKVYSLAACADRYGTAKEFPILWLDADITLHADLSVDRIMADGKDKVIVCLDRGAPWTNMDSGYFLMEEGSEQVINYMYNIYMSGTLFHLREWHDSYVLSRVLDILGPEWYEANVLSLSGKVNSNKAMDYINPLEKTWLKDYAVHLKGNRKGEIHG